MIIVDNPEPLVRELRPDAGELELPGAYVGSANLDFRALMWVRELGVVVRSPVLVAEVAKFFHNCWRLGGRTSVPHDMDSLLHGLEPATTREHPALINVGGSSYRASFSLSPFDLTPRGWDAESEALIALVDSAEETLNICAMEFWHRSISSD